MAIYKYGMNTDESPSNLYSVKLGNRRSTMPIVQIARSFDLGYTEFSPDSSRVVLTAREGNNADSTRLFSMPIDGGELSTVSDTATNSVRRTKRCVFLSYRNQEP
jgi:hypothetical protein